MVLNFIEELSKVVGMFNEYGEFSNLRLNQTKTVDIPLYDCSLEEESRLGSINKDILQMKRDWAAKCLGVTIGPKGKERAWAEALTKYQTRVQSWIS